MNIVPTPLPGVLVLEPKVLGDERGFFVETFRENTLADAVGADLRFVQDNHSRSRRGTLRGLHFQLPPHPQGKLVRVARGQVFDVAVDVRRGSPQFGQWFGTELDDRAHRMLWIPPGFAHGFLVLSDEADFVYKCTDYYDAKLEKGVAWDDPAIGIRWPDPGVPRLTSARDREQPTLAAHTELPSI